MDTCTEVRERRASGDRVNTAHSSYILSFTPRRPNGPRHAPDRSESMLWAVCRTNKTPMRHFRGEFAKYITILVVPSRPNDGVSGCVSVKRECECGRADREGGNTYGSSADTSLKRLVSLSSALASSRWGTSSNR
jgi:hypothetical protein